MDNLVPTTELEAINTMLATIGESPVNSLITTGLTDLAVAKQILREVARKTQVMGWHFNSETNYTLALDGDSKVPVPTNALKIDPIDSDNDYVVRGSFLYDRTDHTYTIDEAVKVDIVFFLDFDQMPEAFRHYVTISAARRFQKRVLGDETINAFTQQDEDEAWVNAANTELDSSDVTLFDDYNSRAIVGRRFNPWRPF